MNLEKQLSKRQTADRLKGKLQDLKEQPKPEVQEIYEDVNTILGNVVDEIWEMFDDDGNGTFDVDETTDFIKHTLTEMGESPEYSEIDFLQCFPSFTEHGKGYMTKLEMMIFIKKVAGLDIGEEQA